jgi:predicted amidohydrolase YtcJ
MKESLLTPPKKRTADLLLTNGTILTLTPGSKPISEGALAIADGRIIEVGAKSQI